MIKQVFATSVATLSLVATVEAATLDTFTGFVGFGDSLSDKGRGPDRGGPYLGGRFSNGPTWMELVSEYFASQSLPNFNLALGGATAGPDNENDLVYTFIDSVTIRDPGNPDDIPLFNLGTFDRQITSFVTAGFDTLVGDNPLVGLLFGGNDFLQNASSPTFNPLDTALDIVAGVARLADLDPKFDDFIVLNLPDIAAAPGSAGLSDLEKALLRGAVQTFNATLEIELGFLEAGQGISIEVFDLFSLNDALLAELGAQGIDVTTPCTADPLCTTIVDAEDYFFVDSVHPNSIVQARTSQAVLQVINPQPAPIPLPGGMSLALVGIGAFGAMRLARKKTA